MRKLNLVDTREKAKALKNSGIYFIKCISNNSIYIGQSRLMRRRLADHFRDLINNRHSNPKLQSIFNKYGVENFEIGVMEICSIDKLDEREQWYLGNTENLINIHTVVGQVPNWKNCDKDRLDYLMDKIQKGINRSGVEEEVDLGLNSVPNTRKKIINRKPSSKVWTREEREAIGDSFKFWNVDTGEIVEGKGLNLFCDERGLNRKRMSSVKNGKCRSHRGWALSTDNPKYISFKRHKQKITQTFS